MKRRRPGLVGDPLQADMFEAADEPAEASSAPTLSTSTSTSTDAVADLLATLADWSERGWMRRLDVALPRFLGEVSPIASAPALAIAMTAHLEGRGHTCLPIADWLDDPASLLGWKPDALGALAAAMLPMPDSVAGWRDALSGCGAVEAFGDAAPAGDADAPPLVLHDDRLYLRRHWTYERRVAAQVLRRAAIDDEVDTAKARYWLDRLFPPSEERPDWQKIACAIALSGRIGIVTGGPGTGKTYIAARLLALRFAMSRQAGSAPMRIALAAPTGKAAARLRQSIDDALAGLRTQLGDDLPVAALSDSLGRAVTLHALLGARPGTRRFRHDAAHPLDFDLVVVDEASMVHLEMMDALLDALPPTARLVLLGDKDQLASVEAGAVLGELCRDAGRGAYTGATARFVEKSSGETLPASCLDDAGPALAQRTTLLRTGRRYGGALARLALAVNGGDAAAATALLIDDADRTVVRWPQPSPAAVVEVAVGGRDGARDGHRALLDAIARRPDDAAATEAWARGVLATFDRCRVLCAVREGDWGVVELNRAVEKRLRGEGLGRGSGGTDWYEGRPVLVTRTDRALGVINGDVGIVLRAAPGDQALRAFFVDGEGVRSIAVSRLGDVETAFAMTVHKSQGSEFAHTVLVLPESAGQMVSRELVYTGITRARDALTLFAPGDGALADAIARTARRSSGLHGMLTGGGDVPPAS